MASPPQDTRRPSVDSGGLRPPELLAPAGGPEALAAALANGADAVYLGLREMNARRGAENFTLESLAEACKKAHLAGARIYLTANIAVLPDEMGRALHLAADAWEAGVDALIVQDLGFMALLARELPEVRVHASTQVNAHSTPMLDVLAGLGCARVTLAREAPLTDVVRFASRPDGLEIETFVHGSLCYCFSGQCLMSSMIGGRSANRGLCAQPCRLPYRLEGRDGAVAEAPGEYLLSPKDLAGIGQLPSLVRAGVASLKIEGRMKAPEYVALVTGVYRAALDRAAADPEGFEVRPAELDILAEAFSRGFTDGYLTGRVGPDMMSYRRPNNRGVPVGRVVDAESGRATVALDRSLSAEDQVEFWTRAGRFAQRAGTLDVGGGRVPRAEAGSRARIAIERPVRPGDRVFRVADADLLAAARRSWTDRDAAAVPVALSVRLRVGEPLAVEARAGDVSSRAEGPVVEEARTRAVTGDDVYQHTAGRLGGSGYVAAEFDLQLDTHAGVGFSVLHAVRREALEALDEARLAGWSGRRLPRPSVEPPAGKHPRCENPLLAVFTEDAASAGSLLEAGAGVVFAESGDPPARVRERVGALLPRVVTDDETAGALARGKAATAGAVTGNIGLLARLAAASPAAAPAADTGANALNPWTVEVLGRVGAGIVWLSHELAGAQVADVAGHSPLPVGVMAFGRTELMVAENCVLAAMGPCGRECRRCRRRAGSWELVDRKGYRFPVRTDGHGRSHVYNSVTLDLSRALPDLVGAGVDLVGVDVRGLGAGEARRIVSAFRERLSLAVAGRLPDDRPLVSPVTTGHFFRGVR